MLVGELEAPLLREVTVRTRSANGTRCLVTARLPVTQPIEPLERVYVRLGDTECLILPLLERREIVAVRSGALDGSEQVRGPCLRQCLCHTGDLRAQIIIHKEDRVQMRLRLEQHETAGHLPGSLRGI